tara:strand:+ start:23 stop:184 length:162 start_codon:yes stop_codon:yes gene_type:complete
LKSTYIELSEDLLGTVEFDPDYDYKKHACSIAEHYSASNYFANPHLFVRIELQ